MVKPLRNKNNAFFRNCISDINIIYYIFILSFLKKILFPLKLFYSFLTIFQEIYKFYEKNCYFFFKIITYIWLKYKLKLYYNIIFQKLYYLNYKNERYIFSEKNILKKTYFSSLIIKPTKLNYLFSGKKKGYSKITETKFRIKKKINILNLKSKIFLRKSFLKEEILLKDSNINIYINKNTLFLIIKKYIYILSKNLIPFLGFGIIKKNIINKTRSYYLLDFGINLRSLIVLYLNENILFKNLKPSLQHKRGIRKKERLKKFKILKILINSYFFSSTLFKHSFYTFIFLISLTLFLEALDIYFNFRLQT